MPRLSLIVATYNRAEQLLTTLRSVAAQTAPAAEWECVVVDNNSTDDTAARFEEFRTAHPELPLRRVSETRQGLSWARNRGIAETVEKTLNSAVANAEHNNHLRAESLVVKKAYVDEGPTMKRIRPRAKGSAARIRKRTSHITIVVAPREEA